MDVKPHHVITTRFVGKSTALEALREALARHARHARERFLVTFLGEPGTGKNTAADELARLAGVEPFVPVNCAALPPTLFEGQLFGHERGAFTGAARQMPGLLERATGGMLFLNEIAELSTEFQAKLLDVVESPWFCRIGGSQRITVPWIVCATNQDLEAELRAGRLRGDFYDRITVHPIRLPPLRDRVADIAPILHELARRRGRDLRVDAAAAALLASYAWPGNVRELRGVFERLFLAAPPTATVEITEEALRRVMAGRAPTELPGPKKCASQRIDEEDLVGAASEMVRRLVSSRRVEAPMARLEREAVVAAYEASGRSVSRAAQLLGMSRWALSRRLADAGVALNDTSNGGEVTSGTDRDADDKNWPNQHRRQVLRFGAKRAQMRATDRRRTPVRREP